MKKIGAIVQARYSSTRLPGKILKELPWDSGVTVLEQVLRRLKRSRLVNSVVIATTTNRKDDKTAAIARREKVACFRGSERDVLSRYYFGALKNGFDIVVRVSSDCPCIDPAIVDDIISLHIKSRADYTSNTLERSYPRGMDVEVFNFGSIEAAYKNADKDYEREHVTPYLYMNPRKFKLAKKLVSKKGFDAADMRLTLDTEEDYALLCLVFDLLYKNNRYFTWRDIIRLFEKKPWLKLVNSRVLQKKLSHSVNSEFNEAIRLLELQGLSKAAGFLKRRNKR